MEAYNKILVPIDVFSSYEQIIERALKLASSPQDIHLLYVAYPQTNLEPYGLFLERDFSDEVRSQALSKLREIAEVYNIPTSHANVEIAIHSIHIGIHIGACFSIMCRLAYHA